MKNAIYHYINAMVFAGFASLTSAQAAQDKEPAIPAAKTPSVSFSSERLSKIQAEEKTSIQMENSVMEMVTDTHIIANYARAGTTKPNVCKDVDAVVAKDFPNLYKQVYADSMDARQNLGVIKEDVKLQRIEGFNMLADFWQSNINVIDKACLEAPTTKPDHKATSQTRQLTP